MTISSILGELIIKKLWPQVKTIKLKIDNKNYTVEKQFITGSEIKSLAGVPPSYGVWLKVTGPGEDRKIKDDEQVDLSKPKQFDPQPTFGYAFFTQC